MNRIATLAICLFAVASFAADEITVNATLSLSSGTVSQSQKSGDLKLDMSASTPVYAGGVLTLTSATTQALDTAGAVADPGFLWAKNASATNVTIYAGPTNAAGVVVAVIELKPGELMIVPRGDEALYFYGATTNPVPLQWFLITR